ncbi:hypothetical protein ENBRE01_2474 [Enteropsectra breve]|nr:hypothetical protein ENBRE01_2474 [Enteropsectra breve]
MRLSLYNLSNTSYSLPSLEHKTEFDELVHSLLLNNKETLSKLKGFDVIGFNILCPRTISLIKQYKFEKFGMQGIVSKADPFYFYSILKEENKATIEKLHRDLARKGLKYGKVESFGEYNNLRNSVKSIACTADVVSDAVNYHLIENLKKATVYAHRYNDNYCLYREEENISHKYNEFKNNKENKREVPLRLKILKIDLNPVYLKEMPLEQRGKNKKLPRLISVYKDLKKKSLPAYSASNLVILSSLSEKRNVSVMKAIGASVSYGRALEITLTTHESRQTIDSFLACLKNLNAEGKSIIITCTGTAYLNKGSENKEKLIKREMVALLCTIYENFFKSKEDTKLCIKFDLPCSYSNDSVIFFKNQILKALTEKFTASSHSQNYEEKTRNMLASRVLFGDARLAVPWFPERQE